MARGSIYPTTLKNGDKRYVARTTVHGKSVGKTFRRKVDAEGWLADRDAENRDEGYRALQPITFAAYVTVWLTVHLLDAFYKASTAAGYRFHLRKHLVPEFGPKKLTEIFPAQVNAFVAKMIKAGQSTRAVVRMLHVLSRIFRDAVSDGYLRTSTMKDVKKPRLSKKRSGRALKPNEIQGILAVLDAETALMVLVAVLTGMRQGEQFGLFWEDIDWDHDRVHVRRQLYWKFGKYHDKAKGQGSYEFLTLKSEYSERDIDLSPLLKKELRKAYVKSKKKGLVFMTKKGTPVLPSNICGRKFRPAVRAAGIEGRVRWHDLRHTFGSLKLAQGESIYYVQRQLGHSSIQVTCDIYGHLLDNRNPEAAAKTDRLVFGDEGKAEIRQGPKAETARNSRRKAQARIKSAIRSYRASRERSSTSPPQ